MSQMTELYQSVGLSTLIVTKQLTDAKSRISKPRVVYNPFSHREPHKVLQPTTNSQQRKNTPLSARHPQPQFIYNAICQGDARDYRGGW